jgi:type I restriction enzyme S subunit
MDNKKEEWELIKLKEIIKTEKGKKPKKLINESNNKALPYLTVDYYRSGVLKQYSEENEKMRIVKPNDLVLIWDGSKSGEIFISDIEGILSSTMVKINIKDVNFNNKYIYWVIKYYFPILNSNTTGSGIPHVSKEVFNNLLVPTPYKDNAPDLQKQKEIAEYLDNLHNKIKRLEELQEKQLNLFKELKESILNKAFKGELV